MKTLITAAVAALSLAGSAVSAKTVTGHIYEVGRTAIWGHGYVELVSGDKCILKEKRSIYKRKVSQGVYIKNKTFTCTGQGIQQGKRDLVGSDLR